MNKVFRKIGKILLLIILAIFMLVCIFEILFVVSAWYKENYM